MDSSRLQRCFVVDLVHTRVKRIAPPERREASCNYGHDINLLAASAFIFKGYLLSVPSAVLRPAPSGFWEKSSVEERVMYGHKMKQPDETIGFVFKTEFLPFSDAVYRKWNEIYSASVIHGSGTLVIWEISTVLRHFWRYLIKSLVERGTMATHLSSR